MNLLKDICTSKDGESYHFAKITGLFILLAFVFLSIFWYGVLGKPGFDPTMWGGIVTTIYSAINAAIRLTHVTEP